MCARGTALVQVRVGIDALLAQPTGGGVYTWVREVTKYLGVLAGDEMRLVVFVTHPLVIPLPEGSGERVRIVPVPLAARGRVMRLLCQMVLLPLLAARYRLDVMLCTANINPPLGLCRLVTVVHDLNWYYISEYIDRLRVQFYRHVFPVLIKRAHAVIVPSRATQRGLIEVCGMDPDRVRVVPEGAPVVQMPHAGDQQGSHVLFVGTLYPHKNVETLLEAYAIVANRIPYNLVVVGKDPDGRQLNRLRRLARRLAVEDRVLFTGFVQDVEEYYRRASVLVFPSRCEGFGLPMLEAMAYGVPVIAARTSSLPEVLGSAGLLVDPDDVEGFAAAILRVTSDHALRERLVREGLSRASQFTWEATARGVKDVLLEVAGMRL